jgi:hypothetical protein
MLCNSNSGSIRDPYTLDLLRYGEYMCSSGPAQTGEDIRMAFVFHATSSNFTSTSLQIDDTAWYWPHPLGLQHTAIPLVSFFTSF